jgi:hypothetical protein
MDGGFNFGEPAKHPARLGASRARTFDGRLLWVVGGLAAAAVLALVFLRGVGEAGHQIADDRDAAVAQVGRGQDTAAQTTVERAVVVARTLYAEQGAFASDPATLSAFEPSIDFTSGSSTGPTSVAYQAETSAFGVAVLSESGACWWGKVEESGTTSYGNGAPCTGRAALGASAPSWQPIT